PGTKVIHRRWLRPWAQKRFINIGFLPYPNNPRALGHASMEDVIFNMLMVNCLRFLGIVRAITLVLATALPLFGQKPGIKAINPASAPMGRTMSIVGDNFGTNAAALSVRFGAAE